MSFIIIKQLNADAQEGSTGETDETAAKTNVPVEQSETMETNETETITEVATETAPEVVNETPSVVDMEIKAPVAETVVTAHDDFDWSVDKRNVTSYTTEEKEKYDVVYDNTFKQINDGEMIMATIESLTKTDAVVNIGFTIFLS